MQFTMIFYKIRKVRSNKNIFSFLMYFLCALFFTSCYNYKKLRLLQDDDKTLPIYEKQDFEDYKIKVNDDVYFRLITSDETISKLISPNSGSSNSQYMVSYRVYTDSTIDIPFVSHIKIAGLTLKEAASVIQNKIKELIPDVEVKVSLANKTFTVIGDIATGTFPVYRNRLTIYQALAMIRDMGETIDKANITIIRETKNGTQILKFDIRPKSIIESKYYYIYPNDIVYIRRSFESFYKVNSYTGLLGIVNFSISLFLTVLNYNN